MAASFSFYMGGWVNEYDDKCTYPCPVFGDMLLM